MTEELGVYGKNDVVMVRKPEEILRDAREAAKSLAAIVAGKKKPVILNGEQYLEFEDWQTVGRFYGISSKIISTSFVEYGGVQGFEARAVAIRNDDGMEVSAAEALCLNDEPNWKIKPLFQLKSMAQTRACAKSLRNVLAWVVVLAGYRPTPAEEMTGKEHDKPPLQEPQKKNGEKTTEKVGENSTQIIIKEVTTQEKTKDGKPMKSPLYWIKSVDGTAYKTFDKKFYDMAKPETDSGLVFAITFNKTQYGNDLVTMGPAEQPKEDESGAQG